MSDWQGVIFQPPPILSTFSFRSGGFGAFLTANRISINAAGTWPAANRALYMPVEVNAPCTAYQMAFVVSVQSGNCDVGIYDELGNRLVSAGSTAVGVAGVQVVDIADTVLAPGVYFLAMNVDNTTASVNRASGGGTADEYRCAGVQQQAVGAVALPNPATFANPASIYAPLLMVSTYQATI